MVIFFKKIKKNTCRYHYQNLDDMIYSSWDIEQNILKLVILGHFLSFYPLKNPKIKILKNEKICWRYHHFTHVHQKSQSYDVRFLRYGVRQSFWAIFCPFTSPLMILNIKILKKMKKMPGDIILLYIHVYHKWRSYDIWFLKYKVQQREIFITKWCMVPEIESMTEIIFCHSGLFFAILPHYGPRKWKFWKNENSILRYYHFKQVCYNNPKNQNFEKKSKKYVEVLPFYTCVP